MGQIRCDRSGPVCVLTIDNESKRNAFSGSMVYELDKYLGEADGDPQVRVIVVTGAGDKAFSSGHDLKEMRDQPEHAFDKDANSGFIRPLTVRKPVIAAVNGYAYAAGFILAMSCDMRVASENTLFATPGARNGLLPIGGQISRLFHLLPHGKVLELLYTGEPMTATDALSLGFVSQVVPAGEALDAARALAEVIARNSPAVIREIKRGVEHSLRHGTDAGELFEWAIADVLRQSPDMTEGVEAFLEKRAPTFADLV